MKNKIGFTAVTAFNVVAMLYCLTTYEAEPLWSGFAMGVSFTVLASILLDD